MHYLTKGNPKTVKGQKKGFQTWIMHLAPHTVSGVGNTCPKATPGCIAACLNLAGRGGMFKDGGPINSIQKARIRKTQEFFADRSAFMFKLAEDIQKAINYSEKKNLTPVFRLNGTSDLSWEKYEVGETGLNLFELFPDVQFYDYTKVLGRKTEQYKNYHLTFSRADGNHKDVPKAIKQGMNVAVVYDKIPDNVYNADETDLRFLDPTVGIIGLKVKGHRAKKDTTGFVIRTIPIKVVV